ncbi:ABC transporter ATP-binding protein [Mycobacterium sp. RTGN5]|uniref:ABC transporter ATP-binding protein n=1 Tax=Mycobacterium sp. RTGN5 TaxID=3016522 RepID=UPI0029C7E24A|nr:ABC transporter ATP-binding protein [Mycobacterium sp. RTGN5]
MRRVCLAIIPPNPLMHWNKGRAALAWALAVLTALLLLPAVWIVRELFDVSIPAGDRRAAFLGCVGLIAIRVVGSGLTLWQRRVSMRLAKAAAADMRLKIAGRVLRADPRIFDSLVPARLQARMVHDSERFDVMLNRLMSVVLPASASAVLAAFGMIVVSPLLSVLGFAVVMVALMAHRYQAARVRRKTKDFQEAFESYAASSAFLVRHVELVRARGFEEGELKRQANVIGRLRDRGNAMADVHAEAGQTQYVVGGLVVVLALIVGGQQVISGTSSVGNLAAFYFAATLLAQALVQVTSARHEVVAGRLATERLTELWDALPPAEISSAPEGFGTSDARVELQCVCAMYDDRMILQGLDLSLRAGEHVDVSGPNGAGKTTLLRVLLGVLTPTSGRVMFDGCDLSRVDGDEVRRRMGWAPQRPTFFDGTIAENLSYGRPDAGIGESYWALEVVGLTDFVDTLPAGIHSPMGDEGVRLSGGEAQRVSIARALIGHPDLVVLDEPGNHLPPTELASILSSIRHALPQVTIITAGHERTCALMADRALVLRDGAFEELVVQG